MTNKEAIKILSNAHLGLPESKKEAFDMAIKALSTPPNDNWEGYSQRLWKAAYERGKADAEQTNALDKIIAEVREWYWEADKQALAKDPCVVDAMIDLFIRTIDKYRAESEDKA